MAFALGGNLGSREAIEDHLRRALAGLHRALGPLTVASLYRTAPIGPAGPIGSAAPLPQPDYLNTAALAETDMEPEAILALAKALERQAGRRRGERFGPRPLDVDLLLWGDRVSAAPELTLPHPRLAARRFMLEPLAEIAPGLPVPPDGTTVAGLLARLEAEGGAGQEVVRVGWSAPVSFD